MKDKELVLGTVISVVSIGIYAYDVISKNRELKKQTQLLKEIKDELGAKKCKKNRVKKHEEPLFHHPV